MIDTLEKEDSARGKSVCVCERESHRKIETVRTGEHDNELGEND